MRFKDTIGITHVLRSAEHEARLAIDTALAPLGITSSQYAVLASLEEHGECTNADLARKCAVTPQTMNRILQNLERDRLVVKSQDPEHALKLIFKLSKGGTSCVCDAHVVVNTVELKMIDAMTASDSKKLQALLKTLVQSLKDS